MRTTKLLKILVLMLAVPLGMVAQSFESGTSKVGSVSSKVSGVWFTITLPEDGQVDLTFEPLGNTSGENLSIYAVVDGEKDRRAFAWVDGENRTLTCPNLKPGTYKVMVHANVRNNKVSGRFRLHYTFTAPFYKTDPTPNATWDDCPLLTDGVTLDGHMGYAYGNADIDNVDWFKIEVPKDGKLTFELWSAPTLTIGFAELCALNAGDAEIQQQGGLKKVAISTDFTVPLVAKGKILTKIASKSAEFPSFTPWINGKSATIGLQVTESAKFGKGILMWLYDENLGYSDYAALRDQAKASLGEPISEFDGGDGSEGWADMSVAYFYNAGKYVMVSYCPWREGGEDWILEEMNMGGHNMMGSISNVLQETHNGRIQIYALEGMTIDYKDFVHEMGK